MSVESNAPLEERVAHAARGVDPNWDDAQTELVLMALHAKRRRRSAMNVAAAGTAVLALAVGVMMLGRGPNDTRSAALAERAGARNFGTAKPVPGASLRTLDGSVAQALDQAGDVVTTRDEPTRVRTEVRRGRVRFDVVHRRERTFEVAAGDVTVQVLGTAFVIERVADRVGVTVERGRVMVKWADGERVLTSGERGWFPPLAPAPQAPPPAPAPSSSSSPSSPQPLLAHRSAASARDDVEDLLSAADAARLAGNLAQAATTLVELVSKHRQDPRAPLAAFTEGRLLLENLGRPSAAAEAFAQVRSLAPAGPLAEDALAREVEARAASGDAARARTLAEEYLRIYPNGQRLATVVRLGGIEARGR